MYILDTNVIIYFLKGDENIKHILIDKISVAPILVSVITEIELLAYPDLQLEEEQKINSFLSRCLSVPIDSRVARIAASLKRECGLGLADSTIVATALAT